ncbi:MAG: T9SS type A sorting domain-containing protein, partial [Luteibaculum sp.]
NQFRIYPNPSHGELFIQAGQLALDQISSMQLVNVLGQEMEISTTQVGESIEIRTNQQDAGVYFLRIQLDNGSWASWKIDFLEK